MTIERPDDLEWNEGDLPAVESVPYGCFILAWFVHDVDPTKYQKMNECQRKHTVDPKHNGTFCQLTMVMPYANELNPLRWVDNSYHPVGYQERCAHWAWVKIE